MTVSPQQYAQSLLQAGRLTGEAWMERCDQLAAEQPIVFLELLSFSRDGASGEQTMALMNYLSTLQHLALTISVEAGRPILVEEFAPVVKQATLFFRAASTDDQAHEARIHKAWFDSVGASEPALWAGCVEWLRETHSIESALGVSITVTLYAVTACYAQRLTVARSGR